MWYLNFFKYNIKTLKFPFYVLENNKCLKYSYVYSSKYLYNKRACPTKNEPQQGISYLEREREGVREREGWEGVRERGV